MPGKDGRVALEEVMRRNPAAPVIMTSGFSREFARGYLPRGGWSFLQKPFDQEQLLAMIRRTLTPKAQ